MHGFINADVKFIGKLSKVTDRTTFGAGVDPEDTANSMPVFGLYPLAELERKLTFALTAQSL